MTFIAAVPVRSIPLTDASPATVRMRAMRRLAKVAAALVAMVALTSGRAQQVREFSSPTGAKILATVFPPAPSAPPTRGLVVHLYGSGGSHTGFNVARPPYEDFRRILAERGYWLIVPDLGPRHWMNDEACATLDATIAAMIAEEQVDPQKIHLIGTSMGGGSGLVYVTRRPGKIRSMVAVFPMTNFERWVSENPRFREAVESAHGLKTGSSANALQAISPINRADAFRDTPVFLIHGDADKVVLPSHSRAFAAALAIRGYDVSYREVRDMAHQDEIARPFQDEMADFLTRPERPR